MVGERPLSDAFSTEWTVVGFTGIHTSATVFLSLVVVVEKSRCGLPPLATMRPELLGEPATGFLAGQLWIRGQKCLQDDLAVVRRKICDTSEPTTQRVSVPTTTV